MTKAQWIAQAKKEIKNAQKRMELTFAEGDEMTEEEIEAVTRDITVLEEKYISFLRTGLALVGEQEPDILEILKSRQKIKFPF